MYLLRNAGIYWSRRKIFYERNPFRLRYINVKYNIVHFIKLNSTYISNINVPIRTLGILKHVFSLKDYVNIILSFSKIILKKNLSTYLRTKPYLLLNILS